MTIFGSAESFNTINRSDPTVTLFDGLFLKKYERDGRKICTQSLIKSIRTIKKFGIDIFDSMVTMRFSA